ncbi:YXWGXW repeat-containing protein [Luteibacter yeojuensis]|uniref:YXWGXW repeat-containing protein n=1 Tax=Luteibacter yeojuensis TaxID=345309 RepID=A0A0F3K1H3_9GAMM|nr:YXWGXW repeat-containing protein [Luteibacter yeojuensis]KJV24842.1 hypothetical protein VI08_20215 [Luteibacter yeojuensis]
MRRALAVPFLALVATVSLSACAPQPRLARNETLVVVHREPPTDATENDPAARDGWVWARGYWAWNGHDYEPVHGHWERDRPGYHYTHAFWEYRKGDWILHAGRWEKD